MWTLQYIKSAFPHTNTVKWVRSCGLHKSPGHESGMWILHIRKLHSWNTFYYCVPESSILYDFKTLKITGYQIMSFPSEVNPPSPKHGTFLGADGAASLWTGQQICWYTSWTANKGRSYIKSIGWGADKPLLLKETSMLRHVSKTWTNSIIFWKNHVIVYA